MLISWCYGSCSDIIRFILTLSSCETKDFFPSCRWIRGNCATECCGSCRPRGQSSGWACSTTVFMWATSPASRATGLLLFYYSASHTHTHLKSIKVTWCRLQCPWRRVPGQPAAPWGPHPGLHPAAGPERAVCRGDLQQGAAAVLQLHRGLRGLSGPEVTAAGAHVAGSSQRCLWVGPGSNAHKKKNLLPVAYCLLVSRLQRPLPVGVQWERRGCVWCEYHGVDPDHSSEEGLCLWGAIWWRENSVPSFITV